MHDTTECFPNRAAAALWQGISERSPLRVIESQIAGATVFDFGVATPGSLQAGLLMAKACMGSLAEIAVVPCDAERFVVANAVTVRTDLPLLACLGCQYAGWPVEASDYFAMGSGPMRLLRGKESVLEELHLSDPSAEVACGLLEADQLPTESAIETLATECGLTPDRLILGIAPSTSIAGAVQIVARSVETAMHKLHDLNFDLRSVISATGSAPLPPPAGAGQTIAGIGRTNDAMLYGAGVSFWVDCDDSQIESILPQIPSSASRDYGRPFASIFADYDHDFYKVDPSLFSPAQVWLHNLRSGKTHVSGQIATDVLRESFGL